MSISFHQSKKFFPKEIVDNYGDVIYQIHSKYINQWVIFGPKGVLSKHNDISSAQKAFIEWRNYFESRKNNK